MNINDLTITSLETITALDMIGKYLFTLDELQNATIANTQETSDITGKQGRKLAKLKRNKAVTISGTNGMLSGGLMEMQTGGSFAEKATVVLHTDYLTVVSNKATTNYKAVGTVGAEIIDVSVRNANGTLAKAMTQGSDVSDGVFTYAPGTKELAFSGLDDGTEIVVRYNRKIQASVLINESDVYSGKCQLYIDALAEDKCANVYHVQFFIPKADFSGEFSIEMSDNQTVHAFEAEALAGACGAGGNLWTYTIYGANAEDAA